MLSVIGFVFSGLALILDIVGVASSDWFHWSVTIGGLTATIKFGLWKCCTEVPGIGSECLSLEDLEIAVSASIKATRGLELLSIVLITVSGSLAVFKICFRKDKRHFLQVAAIVSYAAGSLAIVGAVVFVINNTVQTYLEEHAFRGQVNMKPHTGFALCVTSGILCFVAALLYHLDFFFRKNTVVTV